MLKFLVVTALLVLVSVNTLEIEVAPGLSVINGTIRVQGVDIVSVITTLQNQVRQLESRAMEAYIGNYYINFGYLSSTHPCYPIAFIPQPDTGVGIRSCRQVIPYPPFTFENVSVHVGLKDVTGYPTRTPYYELHHSVKVVPGSITKTNFTVEFKAWYGFAWADADLSFTAIAKP